MRVEEREKRNKRFSWTEVLERCVSRSVQREERLERERGK